MQYNHEFGFDDYFIYIHNYLFSSSIYLSPAGTQQYLHLRMQAAAPRFDINIYIHIHISNGIHISIDANWHNIWHLHRIVAPGPPAWQDNITYHCIPYVANACVGQGGQGSPRLCEYP